MQRVCKLLSAAGVCSRREAELLIQQRRLSLRNEIVAHPAIKLAACDLSQLAIDGKPVDDVLGGAGFAEAAAQQQPRVWRLHKPLGTIVSTASGDCDTVFQLHR
jgi:23S rRNA pseudouridine2605 synthase